MDEEHIVVDDIDDKPVANVSQIPAARITRGQVVNARPPPRLASMPAVPPTERTTRSAAARSKPQPKLKLKLSEKAAQQAPGMSFLGSYDRELDSDDEDLAFEEQFILRMPPGEDCERLRKMVAAREVENDVWFKFKDARRAIFHIGNNLYSAKLVDLPCIIESQKTLDNKQMFKVADICQMLTVETRIPNEDAVNSQKHFNIDEFIWPHGITPPLHWVRKRRFRKRVNRRTIESVEEQVERLLEADAAASQVQYDVLENVNPDLSDSEFADHERTFDAPTPAFGSELGDAPTPALGEDDLAQEEDGDEDGDEEGDGDIDEELAAELNLAFADEDDGDDADEEDEEDESEEDEDEDEDGDDEVSQAKKLLNEEIRDLEAAVSKKESEVASSGNPLIRRRFEDALKKLKSDLALKVAQREEMNEKQRVAKEGASETMDTDGDMGINDEDEGDDDLFGPEESGVPMEIG